MNSKGKYYLTTAIAYTSGKPHIGNVYEIVLADAIARFKRMEGYDVFFQTGTDEHGQKNELKAAEQGLTPKEFVDQVAAIIKEQFDLMNVSYDHFIRTTDDYHEKEVQKIFKYLYDKGDIYKGAYEGLYCTPCESFWTESQLVDGKCPDCGREVRPAKEEAYFFKMSKYAQRLIDYINDHPEFIQPVARKNEMMNNFLLPGLQDLCVSRTSFKWGIPVEFDPKHVVYVWLDALTNYITGVGYHCGEQSTEQFEKLWPADLHLIGKDIIRFHTIYWPIFLMALDLPLPKQVFGHPWLLMNGGKMSKSKGNIIYADDLVNTFGVDAVRYFLLHEMPYDNDGNLTWELVCERTNSDLANVLGNLVNRTVSMSNKYFGGLVENTGVTEEVDGDLRAVAAACRDKVAEKMATLRVADAITEVFNLFKRCNKYIDETMPLGPGQGRGKEAPPGPGPLQPGGLHHPGGQPVKALYARDRREDLRPAEHPGQRLGRPGQDRPVPLRGQGHRKAPDPLRPPGRQRGDGAGAGHGRGQKAPAEDRGGAPAHRGCGLRHLLQVRLPGGEGQGLRGGEEEPEALEVHFRRRHRHRPADPLRHPRLV